MSDLPPASLNILKALSIYHYLTKPQMVELGLAASVASLENHALPRIAPTLDKDTGEEKIPRGKRQDAYHARSLRNGDFPPGERPKKADYMYYLTSKGLDEVYWAFEEEFLSELAEQPFDEIWLPKEKKKLTNEYFHRRAYIDVHIALRRWAAQSGAKLDFITHDYQGDPHRPKLRGRPPSVNHVVWDERRQRRIKPDGLLGLTIGDVSRLFVLELHGEGSETALVIDQLYRNFTAAPAILAKFPHYETSNNTFVLSVHTRPEVLATVKTQVLTNPVFADVLPGLFFAQLDHLKTDFSAAWHYADGRLVEMFNP